MAAPGTEAVAAGVLPERAETSIDPSATLLRSVRRVAQAIDVRSREIARLTGLTLPQLIVLQAVRSLGEVTTLQISREAAMSAPTVVAVLDKLEAKGLVARYRSTRDRRIVHARLTPAGEEALATAPDLLQPGFMAAFRALPEADRQALADAISRIAALMAPPAESLSSATR
jgi:DNA-binding MarR family transcriptional regulator